MTTSNRVRLRFRTVYKKDIRFLPTERLLESYIGGPRRLFISEEDLSAVTFEYGLTASLGLEIKKFRISRGNLRIRNPKGRL